jgi:3',5'-cyclic-AMP phosphodiesterase
MRVRPISPRVAATGTCGRPPRGRARRGALAAAVIVAAGCLEYSPHQLPTSGSERDLHRKALERLAAAPPPAVLRFAVVGDTQLFFDDAERAIASLAARDDLAFVVQVGDFTHVGLWPEFRIMNDLFRRLPVPYFVVVGIHDLLGNGDEIYERMFGPLDLAFDYAGTQFIFLDTNSREYGFDGRVPDLAWLEAQLAPGPGTDRIVVFGHCRAESGDFDPALRAPFSALLRGAGVDLTIHGHDHAYSAGEHEGVPFVVADAVDGRSYLVVTATPAGFEVERVGF